VETLQVFSTFPFPSATASRRTPPTPKDGTLQWAISPSPHYYPTDGKSSPSP